MAEKQYVIPYSLDAQKRHHHEIQSGSVVAFMVQLEVRVQGTWQTVVRYDCAHGFAHCDRYNRKGEQRKEDLEMSFEDALTFADEDLDERWAGYRDRFLKGVFP